MATQKDSYLIVGKIGKPYGIHGWINIYSHTEPEEQLLNYHPWYIGDQKKGFKELVVKNIRPHKNHWVIEIDGINAPESASLLTNKFIAINTVQLDEAKEDEYYWAHLEGLDVVNKEGIELGKVDHLLETGANDVLVVTGKKRHLIPFLKGDVILDIDLDKKIIGVDWDAEF